MTELIRSDAATLAAKIAAKELSSVEITQACLDRSRQPTTGTARFCT